MVCAFVCIGLVFAQNVIEIVAGIVNVTAVSMIDQNGVAGKSDLATGAGIPEGMEPVHDEGPTIEQIHLGVRHRFVLRSGRPRSGAKDRRVTGSRAAAVTSREQSTAAALVVNQFPRKCPGKG